MSNFEDSSESCQMEGLTAEDTNYSCSKRPRLEDSDCETPNTYKKAKTYEENDNVSSESSRSVRKVSTAADVNNDVSSGINNELKSKTEAATILQEPNIGIKIDNVFTLEEITPMKDEPSQAGIKSEYYKVDVKNNTDSELDNSTDVSLSDSEDLDDETSNFKSEGSNKENIDKKNENSHSPDIIMLSDKDDGLLTLQNGTLESTDRHLYTVKKIKTLQNQLRNEEATLILLKKLRQSQISNPQENSQQALPIRHLPNPQQTNQLHMRPHGAPPQLLRGTQHNSKSLHNVSQNSHMRTQQLNNQSLRSQQTPPPPVIVPRTVNGHGGLSQQPSHVSHGNVPQNMSRSNDSSSQQQIQQQQVSQRQVIIPPAPPQVQDTQTSAQRQAAAKQALRKQLEKTLLQIPPPKPPPPEMNFIPSLACPDFILLLGLEEVVNRMIDFQLIARGQKNPDERFVCTPFACVQCGSDFTPVWKREKPGSKNVICEYCVTTNQKKALKQEHTNRLKSAFVKALQQEQEIERMQASTPTPHPGSSSNSQSQHTSAPVISAASAAAANAVAAAAVTSFRSNAEQLSQHRSYMQQAQLRTGQPLGLQAYTRAPFPYNIPFTNQQDLQRQYLLDMIPRGGMPWK